MGTRDVRSHKLYGGDKASQGGKMPEGDIKSKERSKSFSVWHAIYKTSFLLVLLFSTLCVSGCASQETAKIVKSDQDWKKQLTPLQYKVARKGGTEEAFTGEYCNTHDAGVYTCSACDNPLFTSESKFDSGTGWPSFTTPIKEKNVIEKGEFGRKEVLCEKCESHLGHVFPDGPAPTNLRYCINSCSLKFVGRDAK